MSFSDFGQDLRLLLIVPEVYPGPLQTHKIKRFAAIVYAFWLLTIAAKLSILDFRENLRNTSVVQVTLRGGFRRGLRGRVHPLSFLQSLVVIFCNQFEELQSALLEVELIINNAPLIHVYPNIIETCLTPNHLLFRRQLSYSFNTTSTVVRNLTVL